MLDSARRTFPIPDATKRTLHTIARMNVDRSAHVITDSLSAYKNMGKHFASHEQIDHSKEYVRGVIHTNFAESYHSLLKRGIFGTFHHVSDKHPVLGSKHTLRSPPTF